MKLNAVLTGALALSLAHCNKKKDDDETAGATTTTTSASGSTPAGVSATTAGELNLAGAINFELPDAVDGSASALRLAAGDPSGAACQIGEKIHDAMSEMKSSVGGMFCHFAVEHEYGNDINIIDGQDYRINITGEGRGLRNQEMGLKFEVTDEKITIYMCEEGELNEIVNVNSADGDDVKGSVLMKHEGSEGGNSYSYNMSGDFDVDGKVVKMLFKKKGSGSFGGTSSTFQEFLGLKLDSGANALSKLYVSSKGNWSGDTFTYRGVAGAVTNSSSAYTYGAARFIYSSDERGSGGQMDMFDEDGVLVASSASSEFSSGGDLYFEDADVPEALTGFTNTLTGWDCEFSDDVIDIDIDMSSSERQAGHEACSEHSSHEGRNCWSGYSSSSSFTPSSASRDLDDIEDEIDL